MVDVLVALVIGLSALPLIVLVAGLIRLESPGPPILWRLRYGRNGRQFRCYKFRSMYADADARLLGILRANRRRSVEYARYHKLHDDPRITRVGRVLRRLSLDELPQLWNVLLGDMSLVGPRPYDVSELSAMAGRDRIILTVNPGLTGLWQVSGRNRTTFAERLDLDEAYVHAWSPSLEVNILLRTPPVIVTGYGAF